MSAAIVHIDNKIYLCGGKKPSGTSVVDSADVHVYDILANSWQKLANLPFAGDCKGGFYYDGRLYVLSNRWNATDRLMMYDIESNTWQTTILPTKATYNAALLGDCLYFSQGSLNSINQLYLPKMSTRVIDLVPIPTVSKSFHYNLVEVNGKLYTTDGSRLIEFWG